MNPLKFVRWLRRLVRRRKPARPVKRGCVRPVLLYVLPAAGHPAEGLAGRRALGAWWCAGIDDLDPARAWLGRYSIQGLN